MNGFPGDLLYGELVQGKRPVGRPKLRYKDICKRDLKALNIDLDTWEAAASDRTAWRRTIEVGLSRFEETLAQQSVVKRLRRKLVAQSQTDRPAPVFPCVKCGLGLETVLVNGERRANTTSNYVCPSVCLFVSMCAYIIQWENP